MSKNPQDRIAEIDEMLAKKSKQLEQLKAQKRRYEQQIKEKERKERTHRLIELGATIEHIFGRKLTTEDIDLIKKYLPMIIEQHQKEQENKTKN